MQEKTTSSENSSVEVQSKHSVKENTCMTSFEYNRVSIPPKRFRFRLSDARECHSYLQGKALIFNSFQSIFKDRVQSGFYTSQKVRFRLSGDGDYDSSHYKESIPYFTFG